MDGQTFIRAPMTRKRVMSEGERVERSICDRLKRNYPNGPTWYGGRAAAPPLELRMIPAINAVEYNLGNGGWAQFLWNCFDDWREIIADAREGYLLLSGPAQSAALSKLWKLCERDERECRRTLRRADAVLAKRGEDAWSAIFAKYTARSYAAPASDWETLFWGDAIYKKRLAWLAANEGRVRKAMGVLH
jgi:hypothetical protein